MLIQNSQFITLPSALESIHKFVLCVCKFVSVLHISSFVSYLDCTYKKYHTVIVSLSLNLAMIS